jgi:hypothetical protein
MIIIDNSNTNADWLKNASRNKTNKQNDVKKEKSMETETKYPGEFILGVVRNAVKRRLRRKKRRKFKSLGFDYNDRVAEFYLVQSNAVDVKGDSPYTNNALRERIKARIMAGSEGGRPGQWSARKAQLLAVRYRKAGGGYKKGKSPNKSQRSLKKWTREKWRTSDGKPALRDGKMRRYLPDKVWGRLTPAQRAATNRKKIEGDKRGRQFVANTDTAKDKAKNYRERNKS